jgi:hypothetical protein
MLVIFVAKSENKKKDKSFFLNERKINLREREREPIDIPMAKI